MDKHVRPYKCTISNCKAKEFSNAGDLKRHQASIHTSGNRKFHCSVVRCSRRRNGFKRKDNLSEHLRRVHGMEKVEVANSSRELSEDDGKEDEDEDECSIEGCNGDKEKLEANADMVSVSSMGRDPLLKRVLDLERKTAELERENPDFKDFKRMVSYFCREK